MLDEWRLDEVGLWPEIWGKESVGLLEALEHGSAEVLSSSGLTSTGCVNIIDTGELQDLLGNDSGNATSSSWGWDHSNVTGTALSLNLDWDGMDSTDSGTPISSSDWDKVDLGIEKGTLDGNLDLLGALDTDTNVTLSVTDGNDGLESGSLSGLGLLLDGEDAHDLVGELSLGVGEESVSDWGFLDWDGVGVNLLEGLDLSVLDESSELGEWSPFFLLSSSATWASSSATSASTAASSASIAEASASASSASSLTIGWWGSFNWCCWCWGVFHF